MSARFEKNSGVHGVVAVQLGMKHLSRLELLLLLAILVLAGWLRFGWIGTNSFAGDEARISLDALRLTRGGEFVFIAQQSSTGIPFLPASVWMFAPPYLVTPDPLGATLYVALLSWLTVLGVWALARRWGMWAGLCAALFLAASPYAVFYGRSIWQPNLLPFLGLAWAWTAWRALEVDHTDLVRQTPIRTSVGAQYIAPLPSRYLPLIAHIFLAGFIVQVHFAGAALALGTAILFVYGRWWRRWQALLIGGALAALCALPYAWYLITQAPQVLAQLGQIGGGEAAVDLSGARNLLHMALGYDWGYLALGEYDTFSREMVTVVVAGALLGMGAWCVVRSAWCAVRGAKERNEESVGTRHASSSVAAQVMPTHYAPRTTHSDEARLVPTVLLLVWLLASPLFFLRHTTPVLPHYQLVALPALALLVGAATTLVNRQLWRWGVSAAVLALAVAWTTQIALSLERASLERPPQSALSSILRESRDAAFAIPRDRAAIFYTHGDDPAISGEVAVFRVLLWDHPHARIVDGTTTLILPSEPAALMSTLAPFQAWEELVDLELAGDVREFPRRPPGEAFVMTMVDDPSLNPSLGTCTRSPLRTLRGEGLQSQASGSPLHVSGEGMGEGFRAFDIPYGNGTTLEGIRARRVGDRLRISSLWAAGDLTGTPAQAFHHLYRIGEVGDALPQVDDLIPADQLSTPDYGSDVAMGMRNWRANDQVVVMADFFDVPPGIYRLVLGQYTLPDGERVPLAQGGDSVSWVFRCCEPTDINSAQESQ